MPLDVLKGPRMADLPIFRGEKTEESTTAIAAMPKKLLAQLIAEFVGEKTASGDWKNVDANGRKQHLIRCLQFFGSDCDVASITRDDAKAFVKVIANFPLNPSTTKKYKDTVFTRQTMTEMSDKNTGSNLSPKSVNLLLTDVRSFFKWSVEHNHVTTNEFRDLSVIEEDQSITQRLPFKSEDLAKIFGDDIFMRQCCESSEYFLPLLGLYTGARLNELCQLHTTDLKNFGEGVWAISINANDLQKSLINKHSERVIPLHSHLIRLKFVEYVQGLKPGRVFPNLKFDRGKFSNDYTKRFATVRKRVKVIESDFNGFRSLFSTTLETLNVREYHIAMLMGRQHPQITSRVNSNPQEVRQLSQIIETLSFPIDVPPWSFKKKFGTAKCRNRQKKPKTEHSLN